MSNLKYKWLRLLGYKIIRIEKVSHVWDVGDPVYKYSAKVYMQKDTSIKVIRYNEDVADILFSQWKRGELR